jgi:hypothetical protein
MDLLVLIDKLDDLVHNARPVPLTDQVRVDKQELYDLLDRLRAELTAAGSPQTSATPATADPQDITAAVDAAIKANIPAIARAVAAESATGRRDQAPPPQGPF